MQRMLYALAFLAVLASAAAIAVTSADLPAMVASHFGAGGNVNGTMARDEYLRLMLALAVLVPAAIVLSFAWLPRVAPCLVNLPNRRMWLMPSHRDATLATLAVRGAVGAILVTTFICVAHMLVVRANQATPAQLDSTALGVVVGAFMLAMAAWVVELLLRFRRPPA
jgi:hypothetical protein